MIRSEFFDDEVKDDPRDVDKLLSKELLQLSLQNRTAIQEEIHGVHCLAPDETPELLRNSLAELAVELDEGLSPYHTEAYRQSQELLPNNDNGTTNTTYVNTDEFRLRFLRSELFDVPKAAKRLAFFLDMVLEYFGRFALERPIRLSDFNNKELKVMREGRCQLLPFRDRSGRRIIVLFPEMNTAPFRIKKKICLYLCWAAGNDVYAQRHGIVVVVWLEESIQSSNTKPVQTYPKLHQMATVRICAVHCCSPDTPMYRFQRAAATMRCGHNRAKLRVHIGNMVELYYILQSYGIPTDLIPITFSGTVKIQVMRQWMRARAMLEEPSFQNLADFRSSIIECPYPNDIVFRRGTSVLAHPGNVTFRALIAAKFEEIEINSSIHNNNNNNNKDNKDNNNKDNKSKKVKKFKGETRVLAKEMVGEMQRLKLRVLIWNNAEECWKVLDDEHQIYLKVESMVRDYRTVAMAHTNRQRNHSSTTIFYGSNRLGSTKDDIRGGGGGKAVTPTPSTTTDGEEHGMGCFSECFGVQFIDSDEQTTSTTATTLS